jgi:hypothetical protein
VGGFQPRALFALLSGHHKLCGIFIQRDQVHHLWRLSSTNLAHLLAMLVGDPRSVTKMISSYLTQSVGSGCEPCQPKAAVISLRGKP